MMVFLYFGFFCFGLVLGSFLNVVIYRLPLMLLRDPQSISPRFDLCLPASHCPHCQHKLKWWQNIPLFSYIFLGRRCYACKQLISWQYPLVEISSGLLFILGFYLFGLSAALLPALVFSLFLLAMTGIDIKHHLLPDHLTLSLLWLGLIVSLWSIFTDPSSAIIGAVGGYLCLWLVYQLFFLFTGKQGLGYGDFKLLAALGAWLGWQALPLLILISAGLGALFGLGLILLGKHHRHQPFAYGPFLALAGFICLFWQQDIVIAYSHWVGFN